MNLIETIYVHLATSLPFVFLPLYLFSLVVRIKRKKEKKANRIGNWWKGKIYKEKAFIKLSRNKSETQTGASGEGGEWDE
jgi:hypothetical protein